MASKKATTTPSIKGIKDNSQVKEVGSIYRRLGGSDWRINIKLDPSQSKKNFSLSQLGLMARRRILNATENFQPAGYPWTIHVDNATTWLHRRIGECPIKNVSEQEDWKQWCFSFESGGIQFFLPQIELARVLFFRYPYMTRLAMTPNGLNEEFDIQPGDEPGKTEIHILPTSTLPLSARGNPEQRRVLAWILLHEEARRSFNSIAQHQLKEGENINGHRHWQFRFDSPALRNVELSARGQYHKESQAFFVYEVCGVRNLSAQSSNVVEFFDPKFVEQSTGKSGGFQEESRPADGPLINDDELSTVDSGEHILHVPAVILSFSEPALTVRKASNGRRRSGAPKGLKEGSEPGNGQTEVSTDEPTIWGKLPAGGFDTIDDQSNDSHLYTYKFEAFVAMVEVLETKECQILYGGIRKLPALKGCSKHRLADGNPRCLLYRVLNYKRQSYALLEVDTSDNKNKLSTLLLRQPAPNYDWSVSLTDLEQSLIKSSLHWPTNYLNNEFSGGYKRIPHPRSPTENKAFMESTSLSHWAERVRVALMT